MKLTKEPTMNIDKIIEQTAKKILDEHLTNLLRLGYLLQVNKRLMKMYLIGLKHMKKQVYEVNPVGVTSLFGSFM